MSSKDQEILRLQAELARLQAEVASLQEENIVLQQKSSDLSQKGLEKDRKIVEMDKKIESMQATIDSLQNMMAWFRKKMFGSMSEKNLPLDPSVLEPTLFDMSLSEEEQAALAAEVRKMEEQNAKAIEVKSHKREVRKPVMRKDLPVEETHIYPEGVNPDEYTEIGVETTDRIAIRPAVMYIDRTVRHKFVLKSSLQIEDPEKQTFIIASLPEMIIPKGMASESLLADILIDKYVYHLPFYRVIQKYKELGVLLNDSTIGDWFNAVCSKLRPLYDKLRERIMSSDYIQVDESTLSVIDNEKHRAVKGYIWAVRDAVCGDVYFHYDMGSRGGDTARKLIGGYRGTIQTDGYEVYEAYEGAPGKRMIGCWAHARRKFVEALDEDKKHASEALVYIGKLYGIEKEMQESSLDYDIDQLMSYLQKPYYVCMLSAAEMLGAAHQRPQQFSVMTTFPKRRTVSTRNVTIDWFYRDGLPEEALITKNTETGTIRISNPLLTAADLVQYQQHVGGLSRVATILEELSEQIDINNQFAPLATYVKKVVWQRLGYILENVVGEKKLADKLYEQLRTSSGYFKYQPLSTSAEDNPSSRDNRWKININVEIETDDI